MYVLVMIIDYSLSIRWNGFVLLFERRLFVKRMEQASQRCSETNVRKRVFLEQELYAKIRECGWMLYEGSPFLTDTQAQAMNQLVKHGVFELYEDLST